ncbi:CDF family Co(II)/Ni(II) efflux transporter DmeF [Thermoleptolyngbya sp. C42_A2020_037]|uniref:CDF family Co(II)/Ni(II) efflux transporter DmeF n=1 Tax=Thermoleptolyngbya sp. C42_A2020_037 TaxID=2747799 RepID=UPI0019E2F065|nr:CDF family Co(II)/Ni(II) efflux transporter DmeF [Thermoleptolyngbya sp. C42_A2020_037]MBF2085920.1 CDF family Co(II)/Ni(II) efflux transporter DmeF [Thermoleptolyngbya sp. C42_A2020_037]
MHIHTLEPWQHPHDFLIRQDRAERKTQIVLVLTAVTMIAEITAGTLFGSMSLLADGWHMATHVAAFGITVFAYQYARKQANNPQYTFGTGKVSVLGGFTSAIALAVVALLMAIESGYRLFQPQQIQFNEALWVALLGLGVNLVSAVLLQDSHDHSHDHSPDYSSHSHSHDPASHSHQPHLPQERAHSSHTDHNLRAAYVHVLADALTSTLAIAALLAGKFGGWTWLDPIMGVVGAGVIARWAYGLIQETGAILLDGATDRTVRLDLISAIEADADNRVVDLHVWNVSPVHLAATVALVTHDPQPPEHYKNLLKHIPALSHVIVEVNPCQGEDCMSLSSKAL